MLSQRKTANTKSITTTNHAIRKPLPSSTPKIRYVPLRDRDPCPKGIYHPLGCDPNLRQFGKVKKVKVKPAPAKSTIGTRSKTKISDDDFKKKVAVKLAL